MTFCLLSSSLTMVFGVSASSRGDKDKARKWILATIFFGVAFIVLHAIEWKHLIDQGLRPFSLPAQWVEVFTTTDGLLPSPLFGATFFAITGLHMFHVATGAIYLAVVAARMKKLNHEDVEISGLYWHFVDLVWMFVFPLIYIMSVDVGGHLAGH
jgi:cytochrome c oxidase subunit 3